MGSGHRARRQRARVAGRPAGGSRADGGPAHDRVPRPGTTRAADPRTPRPRRGQPGPATGSSTVRGTRGGLPRPSVLVRRGELDLPEKALAHAQPLRPSGGARRSTSRTGVPRTSWAGRASTAAAPPSRSCGSRATGRRPPVGQPPGARRRGHRDQPAGAQAAVAADYAQAGVFRHLPMTDWSFRNAEQTLHLARGRGAWVGVRCEAVVQPVGYGVQPGRPLRCRWATGPCGRRGRGRASWLTVLLTSNPSSMRGGNR